MPITDALPWHCFLSLQKFPNYLERHSKCRVHHSNLDWRWPQHGHLRPEPASQRRLTANKGAKAGKAATKVIWKSTGNTPRLQTCPSRDCVCGTPSRVGWRPAFQSVLSLSNSTIILLGFPLLAPTHPIIASKFYFIRVGIGFIDYLVQLSVHFRKHRATASLKNGCLISAWHFQQEESLPPHP